MLNPVIGGTDPDNVITGPYAAAGRTGTVYTAPWRTLPDEGYNAFASQRTVRSDECSTASNLLGFTYIQIPVSGDYTITYEAFVESKGCPDDPPRCPGDQVVRISLAMEHADDTAFTVNKTEFYAHSPPNEISSLSGSTEEYLLAGKYVRLEININVGTCEGNGYASATIEGPDGAQVIFNGDSIVAYASDPSTESDMNEAKEITTDGYCPNRGTLAATALHWYALQIASPGSRTSTTILELDGSSLGEFEIPFRQIHAYSDSKLFLGRSWRSDEDATVASPVVLYRTKNSGSAWTDITGNSGLSGVTGIISGSDVES
jgi:hypothetical protein